MAYVKVLFRKNVNELINYAFSHQREDSAVSSDLCATDPASAKENFALTRETYEVDSKDYQAVHVIQSWSPEESKRLTKEQVNEMGRRLIEKYWKGHQFLVVTHDHDDHLHNHIIVNTINFDTGKRIARKYHHLHKLRDISDQICLENGLSITNREKKERQTRLPEVAQRIQRYNGKSYLYETMQKADFARKYATNYSEYAAMLSELGIPVQIENKNITYFYPGKERGKRGSNLGSKYDKPELEKTFKRNDELFKNFPELRNEIRGEIKQLNTLGFTHGTTGSLPLDGPHTSGTAQKDYKIFPQNAPGMRGPVYPSDHELGNSIIPISEIRRAKNKSIIEYCNRNKIETALNEKGELILKKRPHVFIQDKEWINSKNKTRGTLIEFVAAHHDLTYLQAIAKINDNSRILLLEKHFGEQKRKFTSFYVPKSNEMDFSNSLKKVNRLLEAHGLSSKASRSLLNNRQVQVSKDGMIRLFAKADDHGAIEFSENQDGTFAKRKVGTFISPFHSTKGSGPRALIYLDPFSSIERYQGNLFSERHRNHGIVVLFEPDEKVIDHYLVDKKHVTKLEVVPATKKKFSQSELDFFNVLKSRYEKYGIEVIQHTPEHERDIGRSGPDLSI